MFDGRVAIVTGAGSGIGAATARLLAERGARLMLVDRDAAGLEATAAAIRENGRESGRQNGGEPRVMVADVADRALAEREVASLATAWGRVDVLVTAAGIASGPGTVLTQDEATWERVWRINVMGTVNWVKAALPAMIAGGGGAIVTVASQLAFTSGGNNCAYIASKGAIVSFTRTTAVDFARQKIRVNAVAPAVIDTPLSRGSASTRPDAAAYRAWRIARHPMGRIGEAGEVARTIAFLASDEASFTTGSIHMVDGGWTAA